MATKKQIKKSVKKHAAVLDFPTQTCPRCKKTFTCAPSLHVAFCTAGKRKCDVCGEVMEEHDEECQFCAHNEE